jgi:hypothetical protein
LAMDREFRYRLTSFTFVNFLEGRVPCFM